MPIPGIPDLPPGGIMPIMGAPMGRPPGGIPGMPGCPPGLFAMFIVPNMNCCGGTPAPALAITFFSSPSLPPAFARGCGTPCPLCGGGVDMTHFFSLFSLYATLLRVRSLSQSKTRLTRQSTSPSLPRGPTRSSPRARRHTPDASTLARARPHARSRPRPSSDRSPLAAAIFPPNVSPPVAHVTVAEHRAPPRLRRAHRVIVALASPPRLASSRAPVVVAIDPSRTTRRRSSPSRGFGPPLSTSRCLLEERARGSRTSGFGVALAIAARAVVLRTRAVAVARRSSRGDPKLEPFVRNFVSLVVS